ncbi:MAG: amidohydrolase family protein [Acidimicrobiia bacterium]
MYHDHHFHPLAYAYMVNGMELMGAADLGEVLSMVADRASRVEGPVIGHRLNDESVAELRLPTAEDIDDVVSDRPVLLYRYCGHIAVANSAALAAAGIDSRTPDPEGGSYDRDPSGQPTGVLRETAIATVSAALAPITPQPTDAAILGALATLPPMGIGSVTGIISARDPILSGLEDELGTLVRLAPDLPIEIDVLVITRDPGELTRAKESLDGAGGRIRFWGWKDFADGSLGGHTAAMYEPFADRPDTRGMVRLDHARAVLMAKISTSLGGVAAIHAIGDRANDLVLDAMAEVIGAGVDPGLLRVEHASVLTNPTIDRMAHLGVTASVQPAFLASEETWLEKRLGPERMGRAYPFRSLLEAGVPLLGGSDCPVEPPDPRIGINAAVDRHGINPDQALSREHAEALFTPPAR